MQQYRIVKKPGYECVLKVENYHTYIHVTFWTQDVAHGPESPKARKQFEMFMEPTELHRLITALQMSQYDWHQHNTQREALYE